MHQDEIKSFEDEHHEVLSSIRWSRIIPPILIGAVVVMYLLWKQFDHVEFAKIQWTVHTLFWFLMAIAFLALRHLAYANRLRILTDNHFSWKKSIELIFIWEFSSAVSPTSIGGAAVAPFILAQEKLSGAKTTTLVLYTVVLDTLFFVVFLPIFIILLGNGITHPTMNDGGFNAWGLSFWTFYTFMIGYGLLFYVGLFVSPIYLKRFLVFFTKIPFLKKHRRAAIRLGDDMVLTSQNLKSKDRKFHLSAFASTSVAWASRFLLLNCLIIALVPDTSLDLINQLTLYARQKAMFVTTVFSPTPGGSGIIEVVFGGFLKDFVPLGISAIVAFIWRFLTYYFYLLAGVIIVPSWIRSVINRRRLEKAAAS